MTLIVPLLSSSFLLLFYPDSAFGCADGVPCTTAQGQPGFCLGNTCITRIDYEVQQNLSFTIVVRYPETTFAALRGSNLYILGSGLGLSWTNGLQLKKTASDTWSKTIVYKSSTDGYQCQSCSDQSYLRNNNLQYRIFVDGRQDMRGANFAITFPLSASSSFFKTPPEIVVFPFFNTTTGTVSSFTLNSTFIGGPRTIALYTPPSFIENTYKKYPTIFAFDIDLRFAILSKYAFEGPILPHGVSEEYVLLGFGDYNQSERMDLLTPTVGEAFDCVNGTQENNCDGCYPGNVSTSELQWYMQNGCGKIIRSRGLGEKTLDFLVNEVYPMAQNLTSNRLIVDKTGIFGYSLGGLMACHAVWTRPWTFRFAACQSSAFWWPINNGTPMTSAFDFINKTLTNSSFLQNRPAQAIYIDVGGNEAGPPFNYLWSAVDAANAISAYEHYELNKNVWIAVYPDKQHNALAWATRVWNALATLLPPSGSPRSFNGTDQCGLIARASRSGSSMVFIVAFFVFVSLSRYA